MKVSNPILRPSTIACVLQQMMYWRLWSSIDPLLWS